MKSIIRILILAVFIVVIGVRCSEDFVNTTNKNALTPELLFTSADNLEYQVRSMYTSIKQRDLWGAQYFSHLIGNISHEVDLQWNSDPIWNNRTINEINSGDTFVRDVWMALYRIVGQANSVLFYADKIEPSANATDKAKLEQMRGEAYFVRAWAYFQLIQLWGEAYQPTTANREKAGVPLHIQLATTPAEAEAPKATVGQVYDQIILDLQAAESRLPDSRPSNQVARAHKWAAKALLGKVYVTQQNWANAATTLKDVIDNGKSQAGASLSLVPFSQFKDMFLGKHEFNSESIFEINMVHDPTRINRTEQGPGNYQIMFIAPTYLRWSASNQTWVRTASGWSNVFPHQKAIDRMNGDPRQRVNAFKPVDDSIMVGGVKHAIGKYFDIADTDTEGWSFRKFTSLEDIANNLGNNTGANFHLLRLADILLLYAETRFAQQSEADAREYLNKVRRRAFGSTNYNTPNAAIDYPASLTGNALLEAIQKERFIELFAEGHWWFDVRRWDIGVKEANYFQKTRGGVIKFDHPIDYWLPIPINELERNPNLTQSTGY